MNNELVNQENTFESELETLYEQFRDYYAQAAYSQAYEVGVRFTDLARQQLGEHDPVYATGLNSLALLNRTLDNYGEAEHLYHQAMGIYRAALGENDPDYAASLNNLATLYYLTGRFDKAALFFQKALEIKQQTRELEQFQKHTDTEGEYNYAITLNNLAALYYTLGRYSQALPLYQQALEITKTVRGETYQYAEWLNNLATVYSAAGQYQEAKTALERALEIYRIEFSSDKSHPAYAVSLNNLAVVYRAIGEYSLAENLHYQALEIDRRFTGEKSVNFAANLSNLAALYIATGRYAQAERFSQNALTIYRETIGVNHPEYATALSSLAGLYVEIGNYPKALLGSKQVVEIRESALGKNHPEYATALHNLAGIYFEIEEYQKAEELCETAIKIRRFSLGELNRDYAGSLTLLAEIYRIQKRFKEALDLCQQGLHIRVKTLGKTHPSVAENYNNLGLLHHSLGEYKLAEHFYAKAVKIRRELLSKSHPDYAASLINLATLLTATGRPKKAFNLLSSALQIHSELIGTVFSFSSEHQRGVYLRTLARYTGTFISLVLEHFKNSSRECRAAFELILERKGIEAEALNIQREVILKGKYPHLRATLSEWIELRRKIARSMLAGPDNNNPGSYRNLLEEWNTQREALEGELARQIPELNITGQLKLAKAEVIRKTLPAKSVLVEFVRLPILAFNTRPDRGEFFWKPDHYLAFIMQKGRRTKIQLVDLGDAEEIDELINFYRWEITGRKEEIAGNLNNPGVLHQRHLLLPVSNSQPLLERPAQKQRSVGEALRYQIFDPLRGALSSRTRLFIAPDSNLTRLPFEILPLDNDLEKENIARTPADYLIDRYTITYLTNGRDLLRFFIPVPDLFKSQSRTKQKQSFLVMADPDFDLAPQPSTNEQVIFTPSSTPSTDHQEDGAAILSQSSPE